MQEQPDDIQPNAETDPLQPIPPQEKSSQPTSSQSGAGGMEDDPTQQPQEVNNIDRNAPDDSDLSRQQKDEIRYNEERPPTEDSAH